jgi:hypothetical protein
MPKYVSISRDVHQKRRWLRPGNFAFVANDTVSSIFGAEVAKAALTMPIALVKHGDAFVLSAVLSLNAKSNMFVAPDGRWLGGYIPALLRFYPFRLLTPEGGTEPVLCIDEDSGLVSESGADGELFFDAEGNVSPALTTVLKFLGELERSRAATNLAVASLEQAGLIVPWPIKVKEEQGERTVQGLYRIDEAVLNALPEDIFIKLRYTGALPVAYAQLLSMGQLAVFQSLHQMQQRLAPKPVAPLPETIDQLFGLGNDETLRFD